MPKGIGKSSVANVPILKHVVRAYQAVYFHEDKKGAAPAEGGAPTAGSDKKGAVAYVVTGSVTEVLMKRVSDPCYGQPGGYPLLCMAAEGTCGDGRGLLEFRTGAFVLGRPVLPVCVKYGATHHNPAWTQVRSHAAAFSCHVVSQGTCIDAACMCIYACMHASGLLCFCMRARVRTCARACVRVRCVMRGVCVRGARHV